jgi:hypothetical protein
MVIALGLAGVEPAVSFGASVVFGLTLAVAGLPGSLLWLADGGSLAEVRQAARAARSVADPGAVSGPRA